MTKTAQKNQEHSWEEGFEPPTKATLFLAAYLKHNFNGTAAAMEVFDIDGPTEAHRRNTAATMAWEYLRKPHIRQALQARMERTDLSLEWILEQLKALVEKEPSADVKLRALDRLAHFLGVELKPKDAGGPQKGGGVHVYLGLPMPEVPTPKQLERVQRIIDAKPTEAKKR